MVALERQPPYKPEAAPAKGKRRDNYPDKGSSVPGCSPSGASPSGACRLELVSSPPPRLPSTSTNAATALSMHFVCSLCIDQETTAKELMRHSHLSGCTHTGSIVENYYKWADKHTNTRTEWQVWTRRGSTHFYSIINEVVTGKTSSTKKLWNIWGPREDTCLKSLVRWDLHWKIVYYLAFDNKVPPYYLSKMRWINTTAGMRLTFSQLIVFTVEAESLLPSSIRTYLCNLIRHALFHREDWCCV